MTVATEVERDPRVSPQAGDVVGNRVVVYVGTADFVMYDVRRASGKCVQKVVMLDTWKRWAKAQRAALCPPRVQSGTHQASLDTGLFFQVNYLANKYLNDNEVRGQSTPFDQTLRALLDIALLQIHTYQRGGYRPWLHFLEIMRREVPSRET